MSTGKQSISISKAIKLLPTKEEDDKWKRYIPILYWLPKYNINNGLFEDIITGLTLGVMSIPQSMAYSSLAGLDPISGIYVTLFAPLIYAIFGTSSQLHVSSIAITSIMSAEAVRYELRDKNEIFNINEIYYSLTAMIAFQVGLIEFIFGILNFGVIANMLSHSVIIGFMCSASLIITMSQINDLLRIQLKGNSFFEMIWNLFKYQIYKIHIPSMILSIFCIIILLIIKIIKKKYKKKNKYIRYIPSALIIVIFGTIISYTTRNLYKFKIIGNLTMNNWYPEPFNFFNSCTINAFINLFSSSILISIISFAESYSMAKDIADKRYYNIEPSQELIAYGLSNIIISFFNGFVSSASVSRTAIAASCKSKTPFHNIIVSLLMLLSLIYLLPLFKWLPKPCLASIVSMAVINLIDINAIKHLYKIKKKDFIVCIITMISTLILNVENGVAIGVFVSILIYIQTSSNSSYAVLGKIPQTINTYKNIKKYFTQIRNDVLIIRWDNNLFFANIQSFKYKITKQIKKFIIKNNIKKDTNWLLILCFSGINDIDVSAIDQLILYFKYLKNKYNNNNNNNFQIAITDLKNNTKKILIRSELIDYDEENIDIDTDIDKLVYVFWDIHHAMYWWDTKFFTTRSNLN